jgi:hypothetical protein
MENTMKTVPCLLSLALLAVLGSAAAQSIDSVTSSGPDPAQAELGDTLTIAGSGLGGPTGLGKPSAFLIDPVTLKKLALKVVTYSDTQVTATVAKAAYGTLDLTLQPKGGELLIKEDAITVPLPVVDGFTPLDATGTIGTTVTVSGSGLLGVVGLSKPKLQLFDPGTGKKYVLKVTSFSGSEVVGTISKGVQGTLELQLIPKGGATILVTDAFEVPLPNISLITPSFAYALELVTLDGEFIGNKKPKVKLGKKTCKVVTFSDSQVTFLMPKKAPKGVQTLTLTNKIGTATQIGAIINQGDVPDVATDSILTGTFGKFKFAAGFPAPFEDLAVVAVLDTNPPPVLTINGNHAESDGLVLSNDAGATLLVPTDPNTFVDPVAFLDAEDGKVEFQFPPAEIFGTPLARWSSDAPGGSYAITVLSVETIDELTGETLMRGAFSGTLVLVLSTDPEAYPETLVVNNGEFRVLFDSTP